MAEHMAEEGETVGLFMMIQQAATVPPVEAMVPLALSASSGVLAVAIRPTPQTSN